MNEITAAVRAELSLLTPDQVCELLQVKRRWLYVQCERGLFPHRKLGQHLRFVPEEVAAYVRGDLQPKATPAPTPRRGRPRKY